MPSKNIIFFYIDDKLNDVFRTEYIMARRTMACLSISCCAFYGVFFLFSEDDKSDYLKIVEGRPVLLQRMDEFELTNRNVR